MIGYREGHSFLHKRNPLIKFLLLVLITVLICVSNYPLLPVLTSVILFVITVFFGDISPADYLRSLRVFIVVALAFMISMTVLRGLSPSEGESVFLGPFSWSPDELMNTVTLGFRIMAFTSMSITFVATTRPRDIALSLIMQCRLPYVHGYAIMAAYRFLPELREYVDSIRLAQKVRGVDDSRNFINRLASPFRMIIPLFCLAARRAERVSCAMESRGLGYGTERKFYNKVQVDRADVLFLAAAILFYAALTVLLVTIGRFHFSFNV